MSMSDILNQAFRTPVNPVGGLLSGIQAGQGIQRGLMQNQLLQAQLAQQPLRDQLLQQQIAQGQQAIEVGQFELDEAQKATARADLERLAREASVLPEERRVDYIRQNVANISGIGGGLAEEVAQLGDSEILSAISSLAPDQQAVPFQKAEGGLVFDPNTGSFSLDPVARDRLDALNAKKEEGDELKFKDKQSINKDLTAIVKSSVAVKRSAEELEGLKNLNSPAAKLGAIFKFMKALDPTSVVRETEQGQVYEDRAQHLSLLVVLIR